MRLAERLKSVRSFSPSDGAIDDETRRNVRRVSVARLISQAGTQAARVALLAIVYQRTHGSGVWLAAVFFVLFAVRALLGPWVGALGDRFDRRAVMICSDLAAACAFVGIAFAHSPYVLLSLSVVAAVAESPFSPAANAQLLMLVPQELQAWATAARATAWWAGVLAGGVIGGALVASVGAPTTFVINAGTFVLSAVLSLRVTGGPYRAAPSTDAAHHGTWAGVRLLAREPALRLSTASISLGFLGAGMMNVAEYPLFVKLGGGSVGYGVGIAAWGVGGILGGRSARGRLGAASEKHTLIRGQAMLAAGMIACGVIPFVAPVVILFAVSGFGDAAAIASASLIARRWAPDAVRARVFGASDSITSAALGLSLGAAAGTLPALGAQGVFIFGGAVTFLAVGLARRVPPRGQPIDRTPKAARSVEGPDSEARSLVPVLV